MLGLLKWVIGLTIILSALIVLARVAAPPDVYAFPLSTINLTADCQLPCWHGITPGVTTRAEALATFDADPAYTLTETDEGNLHAGYNASSDSATSIYFNENGIVRGIELYGGSASIYHLLAKLGKPTSVLFGLTCGQIWHEFFPRLQVGAGLPGDMPSNLYNYKALKQITISIDTFHLIDSFLQQDDLSEWRGFRSNYVPNRGPAYCD